MLFRRNNRFYGSARSFNMTPVIDIVFLLIIFFLVVCQFIESENFPVSVPDGCDFAERLQANQSGVIALTVMKSDGGAVDFAVGSEKVTASSFSDLVTGLIELINFRAGDMPESERVVHLRIDRDICFSEAQCALAAVADSSVTKIRLAVLKQ